MARVVIDANVIISAAYGGTPLEALVLALERHEVYVSDSVRHELEKTFLKLSGKLSKQKILFMDARIQQIVSIAKCVAVSSQVTLSRDPADDHYLALCKQVNADFLITGDKDLLSICLADLRKSGISCFIVSPKSFLETVTP